jgi:DNA ligase-associated metallophosphoesterase
VNAFTFARFAQGGLRVSLNGADLICRCSGAAWIEAERAVVVADLHLEKGSHFARWGQPLPPFDTADALDRLEAELDILNPRTVIFLGDSFHDRAAEARLSPGDAARLTALGRQRHLVWIAGNHDAEGPRSLPGEVVSALDLSGLRLVHEPVPDAPPGELAGHLHPCARLPAGPRRRCFVSDGRRLILPAFGAYAGGLNVRDAAFRPLLRRPILAGLLGSNAVHPIKWTALCGD